jgi:fermentation-respiration switch protein FrsA (DUF1100 family)
VTRTLIGLLFILALAYGAIALLLLLFQERLVYYPQMGRDQRLDPRDHGLQHASLTLATPDGERLDAWFVPAPGSDAAALIFHGNAGNMTQRMDTIAMFHRLGYSVLIFDYRGYGRSTGRPSEQGLYRDAMAAWDYLTRERGIAPGRIVLFGESLGGAVAAWLAAQVGGNGQQPGALVLASAFTSAPELAADLYPWLPTRGLVRMRYDTRAALKEISCPVFIAHSPDDDIIPYRHGQMLYQAAGEPKAFLEMAGGHNEGFIFMLPAWVGTLGAFLRQHVVPFTEASAPE